MVVIFGGSPALAPYSDPACSAHIAILRMPRTRRPRQGPCAPAGQRTNSRRADGGRYLRALIAKQELALRKDVERTSDGEDDFDVDGSVLSQFERADPSDSSISGQSSRRDNH